MTAYKQSQAAPVSVTVDQLLNLVPEDPNAVLARLEEQPELASAQDSHGYNLFHAAASFSQANLLKSLVKDFGVPANILDEDGDTALFVVEDDKIADLLVRELGINVFHRNAKGLTAREFIEDEDDFPAVVAWLRKAEHEFSRFDTNSAKSQLKEKSRVHNSPHRGKVNNHENLNGDDSTSPTAVMKTEGPPPPLPPGVSVNLESVPESTLDVPDPIFRHRIEQLASRDDFEGEESQKQLKKLVTDAVNGLTLDEVMKNDVKRRA